MTEVLIVIGGLLAFIGLAGLIMVIAQRESVQSIRHEPTEHGPFQ